MATSIIIQRLKFKNKKQTHSLNFFFGLVLFKTKITILMKFFTFVQMTVKNYKAEISDLWDGHDGIPESGFAVEDNLVKAVLNRPEKEYNLKHCR